MKCSCEGAKCKLDADSPRHGRPTGYKKHGCRCRACREANAEYQAEWLSRDDDDDVTITITVTRAERRAIAELASHHLLTVPEYGRFRMMQDPIERI
ncbi:hypothetical protein MRBLMI12_000489 [Microbacterium sp. LMI12-1-1.1]|uniref:hypothetical protein n=1 Tax=Microbacterium sp. LMI12-1-1.1 TaxID=3135225 RepID=UPI003435C677